MAGPCSVNGILFLILSLLLEDTRRASIHTRVSENNCSRHPGGQALCQIQAKGEGARPSAFNARYGALCP
jgi:hypothetical protein